MRLVDVMKEDIQRAGVTEDAGIGEMVADDVFVTPKGFTAAGQQL